MKKKQRKIQVHVEDLAASGRRFVDAWRRRERDEVVREEHLSFVSSDVVPIFPSQRSRADSAGITNASMATFEPSKLPACWKKARTGCARRLLAPKPSSLSPEVGGRLDPNACGPLS
jgi:hypothetical protein